MKIGDMVLLKPLSFFHIEGTKDLREVVKQKLLEEMGVGIIMDFDKENHDVCVYWSNDDCTWEYREDLELISEEETN